MKYLWRLYQFGQIGQHGKRQEKIAYVYWDQDDCETPVKSFSWQISHIL